MERPVPPPPPVLPKHTELSPQQFAFLEEHFRTREDLLVGAPHVSAALNQRCADLDADLLHLQRDLSNRAVSWISRSFAARTSIHRLNLKLENLSLRSAPHGIGSKVWREELPWLAKKVRQIEGIRNYVGELRNSKRL